MLHKKDFVIGFVIWNLSDFRTSQSSFRIMQNRKGVLNRIKEPKLAAKVVKEVFQQGRGEGR
ncbi:MAG TPA: hypothetical protein EYP53_10505 [Candidatus Latescibacteria bacterium]|nr:hypothetical protein [Candidatus Latescibacterota bacterium]